MSALSFKMGIWGDGGLTWGSSVNDFALYQVALGLGHMKDAEKYLNRSRNWRNHWNKDMSALGHTGFLGPRNAQGKFLRQDPLSCGGCYWGDNCKSSPPQHHTDSLYT